jgi:hypothetical protein
MAFRINGAEYAHTRNPPAAITALSVACLQAVAAKGDYLPLLWSNPGIGGPRHIEHLRSMSRRTP